jgi:Fe-S oxidoreductase
VLESKLATIAATGADVVITDNPGCLTHLRGGLDARNQRVKVRHIAEVLWDSLSSPD